ncbi:MAG: fibronectin type III domain-containing protein [Propionibacteriaceae bacterium]|jgi:hypothetical protein|nr:fibronectin type III domain-containing protein [Propionibacteriaceae bacterium]
MAGSGNGSQGATAATPATGWRGKRKAVASVSSVVAFALTITGIALVRDGFALTELDLHDSGVWVTQQNQLRLARFNYEASRFDATVDGIDVGSRFDVLQEAASIFVHDSAEGAGSVIDPAQAKQGSTVETTAGSSVSLGGGYASLLLPDVSSLYVVPESMLPSFSVEQAEPVVTDLAQGAASVTGIDGLTHVVDPATGAVTTVTPRIAEDGSIYYETAAVTLDDLSDKGSFQITAVGATPVVYDESAQMIHIGERAVPVEGAPAAGTSENTGTDEADGSAGSATPAPSASPSTAPASGDAEGPFRVALQQPSATGVAGASGDVVVYSTSKSLVTQPFGGDDPRVVPAEVTGGQPAQPVALAGCSYSVWSGTRAFARDCVTDEADSAEIVEAAAPDDALAFRVNRGHVVLNQVGGGGVWLVTGALEKVDDWEELLATDDVGEESDDTTEETQTMLTAERPEENHDPTANDDTFGVRAGRSTILPVVENDTEEDYGDMLTVSVDGGGPLFGTVATVYNDTAFQIDVPEDATGSTSFSYRVSDGRGGEDTATVRIEVHADDVNAPPELKSTRRGDLTVPSGREVTTNVLTDWRDPDGDDIYLLAATSPGVEDVVQFTPDGQVTFRDGGRSTGIKNVPLIVSDGTATAEQPLVVNVVPDGQPPSTLPDIASGPAGTDILVTPLANDIDPDGQELRLVSVEGGAGATVTPDLSAGTFTVRADQPGSHYFSYLASDGPTAARDYVRVDILAPAQPDAAPIAVPDTVMLSKGQEARGAVLANDVNPLGYPLVVTSVQVPEGAPVAVAIINHETLRITETREFSNAFSFSYTISNGHGTARSMVTVVPVAAPSQVLPPDAADDEIRIRAGDIATVDVLANDTHPNGIPLRLRTAFPEQRLPDPDSEALVFTMENTIRVHARQTPGIYTVLYQVEATQGTAEPDTGRLTIHVVAADPETNQAPTPELVEARTVNGMPVTIPIPLNGIDPEGDYVELRGLGTAPDQGRIIEVTATGFVFDPGSTAVGQARFTYIVRDRLGAEATGNVIVGIGQRSGENSPPVAVTDAVESKPGRELNPAVTLNDTDPDGDIPALVTDSAVGGEGMGPIETIEGRLSFTAPEEPGDYYATYEIEDSFGQRATGIVTIKVDETIEAKKPTPRDDVVTYLEALNVASVEVRVLDNDEDPDGDVRANVLDVDLDTATVSADGLVTIPVLAETQIIDYTLTDPDGLVGEAFITVPGSATIPPLAKPDIEELRVVAGDSLDLRLEDYVLTAEGKAVRVTEAAKVTAWNGEPSLVSETVVRFTAPEKFVGEAAISFEVTDGAGPDDPNGLKSIITVPILVTASDGSMSTPPSMLGAHLDVEVGTDATLDLSALVQDPDIDETFTFEVTAAPSIEGVSAAIDGSTLVVTAEHAVAKGQTGVMRVNVSDGHNDPVEAEITLSTVSSRLPLAQTVDDEVPDLHQGDTICVPVTDNDVNPVPGTPLRVVTGMVVVETGNGTATPGCSGEGSVAVTAAPDFHGTMVVRYTVEDAFEDIDRYVDGRIYVNVKGRPEAPTGVQINEVGNRFVLLEWSPAINNGAPVTGYTVTAAGGAGGPWQCGTATICNLDGLTNNVTYTFTVTATNEVGTSDPSAASAEARPDTIPNHAAAPVLKFGDKQLEITWTNPGSEGSPVESYDLEISPTPDNGQYSTNIVGTTHTWTGLTNGVEYRVRICPRNLAEGVCEENRESQMSSWSAGEVPAGPPLAPSAPSIKRLDPVGSQGQVQVCWDAPNNNGDAVNEYTVTSSTGQVATTSGSSTCQAFVLPTSTTEYTFTVKAKNKAGYGETSAASSPFRSFVAPGAVTGLTKTDRDRACDVSFGAAALNGANAGEVTYYYRLSSGATGNFGGSTSGTIGGLANNSTYNITVWAASTAQGVTYKGPETTVNGCAPYGPPNQPNLSASASGDRVNFSWSPPSANGRAVTDIVVAGTSRGPGNGSDSNGGSYSTQYCVDAYTVDSAGQHSATRRACATTGPAPSFTLQPDPSWSVLPGTSGSNGSGCGTIDGERCANIQLVTRNFSGNVGCTVWTDFANDGNRSVLWSGEIGGNTTYTLGTWTGRNVSVYATCGGLPEQGYDQRDVPGSGGIPTVIWK